jgi:hypothetical protein
MDLAEILERIDFARQWSQRAYVFFHCFYEEDTKRLMGEPVKMIENEADLFFIGKPVPSVYYRKDGLYAVAYTDIDQPKTIFTDQQFIDYLAMNEGFGYQGIESMLENGLISLRGPLKNVMGFEPLSEEWTKEFMELREFSFFAETNFMQHYKSEITARQIKIGEGSLVLFSYESGKVSEYLLFYVDKPKNQNL